MDAPRNDAPRRSGRGFIDIDNSRNLSHPRRASSKQTARRIDFAELNRPAMPLADRTPSMSVEG